MKNRTKLMFAEKLEEMLREMPMEKVRVVDLCRRCDTIPPTFYYHFHDKYELVAWIFLYDFTSVYGDKDPGFNVERIILNLNRMNERRKFYQKAYNDHSQNAINHYIQQFNVESAVTALHHACSTRIPEASSSQEEPQVKLGGKQRKSGNIRHWVLPLLF